MRRDLMLDLTRFGMLARRADLLALGHSRSSVSAAVQSGILRVPRRGWVAAAGVDPLALRAVRLGGKLGGASALAHRGIWVDDAPPLVVSTAPTASRLPALQPGESRVWLPERFPELTDVRWRASVRDAILQYGLVAGRDQLIATMDSALFQRFLTWQEVDEVLPLVREVARPGRRELDGLAMSGTESRMRVALRRRGLRVRSQVSIRRVGQVDLVVDDWLIVECDSRQFHDGEPQQIADRRRDGEASLSSYGSARFHHSQIMSDLDWCVSVVESHLRRGRPARLDRSKLQSTG
ncbi:endonuclease domain-containing protein [Lacisediminihabitans changchengi]|uniref:DUF559 domain-containing protein n=1 Tax=Lacisediminihabitans changchengi TaxID=2787634 RepID=A0A934W3G3_9MICO|nr:hypothetical protein [Lacisediminihabitans changchengi]MBK4346485.1 hypothetical protein [Lacisediminihabitans changchengi]MBK4348887.1 hypothetical protein [Lacisediminihabitans changchengi]